MDYKSKLTNDCEEYAPIYIEKLVNDGINVKYVDGDLLGYSEEEILDISIKKSFIDDCLRDGEEDHNVIKYYLDRWISCQPVLATNKLRELNVNEISVRCSIVDEYVSNRCFRVKLFIQYRG